MANPMLDQSSATAHGPAEMGMDLDSLVGAPSRKRVMVVDDDPDTVFLVKLLLRRQGYDVLGALGGMEAVKKCASLAPDLVLLDLMMPGMDGWETMRDMRQFSNAPVIIVSAKGTKDDVIQGLQSGADDYITKPFHDGELLARVQNVLRRNVQTAVMHRMIFSDVGLTIDHDTKTVTINGSDARLTQREFEICALLARHANETVTHETIGAEIWGEYNSDVHNRIRYLIYLLRRKLEKDYRNPHIILTRDGLGYMLRTKP